MVGHDNGGGGGVFDWQTTMPIDALRGGGKGISHFYYRSWEDVAIKFSGSLVQPGSQKTFPPLGHHYLFLFVCRNCGKSTQKLKLCRLITVLKFTGNWAILTLRMGYWLLYYHPYNPPTQKIVLTQSPYRMSWGLALSLGLIARHDLKNEAAGEISFSAIVPHWVSKLSSFPRVSFAVTMGEAMYESEKSGVPVNRRNV